MNFNNFLGQNTKFNPNFPPYIICYIFIKRVTLLQLYNSNNNNNNNKKIIIVNQINWKSEI
jgi:hypothetical protein